MNTGPKENENPTILDVPSSDSSSNRQKALACPDMAAIFQTEDLPEPRSRVDRSILQALSDAATVDQGKHVSLLKNVGLDIPDTPTKMAPVYREPLFVPFQPSPTSATNTPKTTHTDTIDAEEIFTIIRNIQDPEHPLTLEQLGVVSQPQIEFLGEKNLQVRFTPTIPHCSMATLIGLCLRVKLLRSLPGYKIEVKIEPGTHQSEVSVNKQLADKERVCAALENKHLAGVVNRCIGNGMTGNMSAAV